MRMQIRKTEAPKAIASIGEANDEGCGRQQQDGEFVPGLEGQYDNSWRWLGVARVGFTSGD
jgi:hypothetical protein